MLMKKAVLLLCIITAVIFANGCGGGNDPTKVAEKFFKASVKGDYRACLKYNFVMQVQDSLDHVKAEKMADEGFKEMKERKYKFNKAVIEEEPRSMKVKIDDGEILDGWMSRKRGGKEFEFEAVKCVIHFTEDKKEKSFALPLIKITDEIKKDYPLISFKVGDWAVAKNIFD